MYQTVFHQGQVAVVTGLLGSYSQLRRTLLDSECDGLMSTLTYTSSSRRPSM